MCIILQRLQGDGYAFVHAGGTLVEKNLALYEKVRIDTDCVAAMQSSVSYDIDFVTSLKTAIFGDRKDVLC